MLATKRSPGGPSAIEKRVDGQPRRANSFAIICTGFDRQSVPDRIDFRRAASLVFWAMVSVLYTWANTVATHAGARISSTMLKSSS
jgi:hypothetical protein